MKLSLACLAALVLPYVANADHFICTRLFEPLAGQMLHVVILDHHKQVIMRETKNFFMAKHFTIKNSRGRFDMKGNGWSAAFDGQDWGGYQFQETFDNGSVHRLGCYGNSGYCEADSVAGLRKKCYSLLG